ncbi:flagellar hook-length control protein FliK [uncultured Litoreibacter sp.]|uniref:flagellar hook-length control protein FliK n=1 Tax=uncultured Litoreibacter sp. TaxID=1392394 RepID=UPI0026188874|nr:flagellar hook-length control protein FliK [uncultured Litoreibacter sp.]
MDLSDLIGLPANLPVVRTSEIQQSAKSQGIEGTLFLSEFGDADGEPSSEWSRLEEMPPIAGRDMKSLTGRSETIEDLAVPAAAGLFRKAPEWPNPTEIEPSRPTASNPKIDEDAPVDSDAQIVGGPPVDGDARAVGDNGRVANVSVERPASVETSQNPPSGKQQSVEPTPRPTEQPLLPDVQALRESQPNGHAGIKLEERLGPVSASVDAQNARMGMDISQQNSTAKSDAQPGTLVISSTADRKITRPEARPVSQLPSREGAEQHFDRTVQNSERTFEAGDLRRSYKGVNTEGVALRHQKIIPAQSPQPAVIQADDGIGQKIGTGPSEKLMGADSSFEHLGKSPSGVSEVALGSSSANLRSPLPSVANVYAPNPAVQVAAQILAKGGNGDVREFEIRLDPEELGKLRINIGPKELGLVVTITAERQETLELLRRHSDDLLENLEHMGFDGAALEFHQGHETDQQFDQDDEATFLPPSLEPIQELPHQQVTTIRNDRLDIRL